MIERVQGVVDVSWTVLQRLGSFLEEELEPLARYLLLVEKIIDQSERRIFQGEIIPADAKIYSLFEDHTELLIRGKAGKNIEFGHKILIGQSSEKYITHYQVLPKRREDTELLEHALEAHKTLFGTEPNVLAADKGFYKNRERLDALAEKIETVAIAKKGRRNAAETEREQKEDFKEGQRFRAGVEGTISVLKRAYKLNKCLFKGFKNFAVSVGCAIFCHNLVLLTKL